MLHIEKSVLPLARKTFDQAGKQAKCRSVLRIVQTDDGRTFETDPFETEPRPSLFLTPSENIFEPMENGEALKRFTP